MVKTVEIEVTQDDIDQGTPCRTSECPVARATQRKLGLPVKVLNYAILVGVDKKGKLWSNYFEVSSPVSVRQFIQMFDFHKSNDPTIKTNKPEPFTFTLPILK